MTIDEAYGQKAYEGYYRYSGGKSLISGAELPSWDDQKDEIKAAWNAAAEAVIQDVLRKNSE